MMLSNMTRHTEEWFSLAILVYFPANDTLDSLMIKTTLLTLLTHSDIPFN